MRWLLDEMFPPAAAECLEELGHDAVSVIDVDLRNVYDSDVLEFAVAEQRAFVTENFQDFATLVEQRQRRDEERVPVLFVRKSAFPSGGALPTRLARHLHEWSEANPEPYEGVHWP